MLWLLIPGVFSVPIANREWLFWAAFIRSVSRPFAWALRVFDAVKCGIESIKTKRFAKNRNFSV
ncbi:hypothetical protein J2S34_003889 [Nitrobacter winogradskyi]|uniref:Uncharacterized protein n=1 Tax=Nitrobacter winogradskyi TaxID=913 RepID=A0ACC6ANF9_NITWI|nr:hypothetical protein [Nitrobacter winogradskyi]